MAKMAEAVFKSTAKVQLSLAARNLPDKDTFSKTDPMAVLWVKNPEQTKFKEFGRTERIDNNLNPDFARKFELDYHFEKKQIIKIQVYHMRNKSHDLKEQTFIGEVEFPLAKAAVQKLRANLLNGKAPQGKIEVVVEELSDSKEELELQFEGIKLDRKDLLGSSDPFLEIWKENEMENGFTLVYRTEEIKNNLNPKWNVIKITTQSLCGGDTERKLLLICYDWNLNGSHSEIGTFTTTAEKLASGRGKANEYNIVLTKYRKNMKNTMLEFTQGGTEILATVAIDFTESNGDPKSPKSLHYSSPSGGGNMYERAIHSVVGIIEDYDSDKKIPAYGFGAILPGKQDVSHMFALNSNKDDPDCHGVKEVIQAYTHSLGKVRLASPTYFAPIIEAVAKEAAGARDGKEYHILLILTDGVINDMKATMKAIINASNLPLSIIIIGIGDEDFSAMEILDGDGDRRLQLKGKKAERDIVQFVAMNHYAESSREGELAKAVLEEVPEQLLSYMASKGIPPGSGQTVRL